MELDILAPSKTATPEVAQTGCDDTGGADANTIFLDNFCWKIIDHFCWSDVDNLSWEDFYNHINVKIINFPYSQNVMNILYEFITKKAILLHSKIFLKICTFNIDTVIVKSILEEIVSRGVDYYNTATEDLVYDMYIHGQYTIPGGLCSLFTSLNGVKIMKCVHIPHMDDEVDDGTYCASEEENIDI